MDNKRESFSIFSKNIFEFIISFPSDPWTVGQAIWTFCFALILVVSIIGNCIVLWIILGKYSRLVAQYYQLIAS